MRSELITFEPLNLIYDPGPDPARPWVVEKNCMVRLNGSYLTLIEAGYRTDKTSWPRELLEWFRWLPFVARWLDETSERYDDAAVLHDHLLDTTQRSKRDIDLLYLAALGSTGVSSLESVIFWLAVRTRTPGKAFRA